MAIKKINTEKIREISDDVIVQSNQFEILINKLFKRFSEVPYNTKEWIGDKSELYFKTISLDKSEYINFANEIRNFGKVLKDNCNDIEETIEKTQKNEEKGN